MKKMQSARNFILGMAVMLIICATIVTSYAVSTSKQITAVYNDIKLVVDGRTIEPKDTDGNVVEPFIADGTTYLPVRALAEALGKPVEWDGATNTVYVGSRTSAIDTYMETLTAVNSDRYTGNMGDSFIGTIGERNGNLDVDGNMYTHGLTAWIARWNGSRETSWAWNEYDISSGYSYLQGKIVLIKSHNETDFDTKFEIIGDGNVLYSIDLTPQNLPTTELKIDVRGVNSLIIKLHDNRSVAGGTAFGLANFGLVK